MNEQEMRELDVQVHRALYPGVTLAVRGCGNIPTHWVDVGRMVEIPRYTTDIADWEPIYALRPEWRWTFELVTDDEGQCAWDVYMAAPVIGAGHYRTYETPYIYEREARGWAAVALGMSRCVLQWAEAQHGG
jgi:hypothetical protein